MTAPRYGLPTPGNDWAMFLDIDGTLMEFAMRPGDVRANDLQLARLVRLREACDGALALVSGRRLSDIDLVFPRVAFAAAGQHGVERREAGGAVHTRAPATPGFENARAFVASMAAGLPGSVLEDKGESFALHYRAAPAMASSALAVLRAAERMAGDAYAIQAGNLVVELKPRGVNKGSAIFDFMDEAPFAGRRPVFVGDDVTDEDGFLAVNALGGHSIKVGAGETRAAWRISDVRALGAWLDDVSMRMAAGKRPTRRSNERATVRG